MLIFPDKLKSNNTGDYGIIDLNQASGARVVPYVENLFQISDALLSTDGNGANSIGQCWFVSDNTTKYYLTNWELRHTISGWTSELMYSLGVGVNQAFQGSRGLALENRLDNLILNIDGLTGLAYFTEIFYQNEINQSLNLNYGFNVIGTISASTYYNLPIASNSVLGIASFSGSQFNVVNGVVSIKTEVLGGGTGGLNEAELATYLNSHGYSTSAKTINYLISGGTAAALDTLNELSAALGNDPNFATTITNSIGTKWTQDNAKISNWDLAFVNTHTHTNKSVLDSISTTTVSNWNTTYANTHSHLNKSVLDNITSNDITNWGLAFTNTHTHANYDILSGITAEKLLSQSNIDVLSHLSIVEGKLQIDIDAYSTGELAAYGIGSGSTSGSTGYNRLDLWSSYDPDPNTGTTGYVLSAFLGYDLYNRLNTLTPQTIGAESYLGNPTGNGYLLSSTTNGTRTWVAPYVHPTGVTGTFTKVVTDNYGHVISGITPTTLSGYSISDAYTKTYIDTYLQVKYAGMSLFSGFTTSGNQITLPNSKVRLYSTSDFTGYVQEYNLSQTTFTITSQAVHFIVADYNAGTPIYYLTTNRGIINYSNVIPVVTLIYDGVKIHSVNWDESANGTAERLNKKLNRTDRFKRESGLSISVDAARNITVSSGVIWFGVNTVTYPTSLSITNNIYQYYHSGGTWVYSRSATLNNTQYDNGTNLLTLSNNNRYAVNWVYAGVGDDGDIFTLLGTADYDLAGAISAQPPASVPDVILFHGMLVGKVIYPYGVNTAYSAISITDNVTTAGGSVVEHNNLNGIQGGVPGEYYHLNSSEVYELHNFSGFTSVAGTYTKVVTDTKGRVVSGTTLSVNDIPLLPWSKINSGTTPTTLSGYGITNGVTIESAQTITGSKTFVSGITLSNGVDFVELKVNENGDLYIVGNVLASGEVAAYALGSSGISSGSSSSLGELVNVEDDVDDFPAQQYFLFRDSGSTHWSRKLLSDLSVTWSNLAGKPTTLSGYGVSVSDTLFDSKYSTLNHTHSYLNLTGLTLTGGITGTSASFASGITSNKGIFTNLTDNFIVKDSANGLVDSVIYDNGTNVGVSTTNPLFKLDVNGTLRVVGEAYFNSTLTVSGATRIGNSTSSGLTIWNGTTGVTLTVDENGNLKINGNMYATGEVAAYASGGTIGDIGPTSSLGELINVEDNVDDVLPYQYFLFKDSGATHWSKKLLSDLSVTWSNLAGKPTTLSGYGVSVSDTLFDSKYSPSNHTHSGLSLTGLTLSGGVTGTSASFTSGITSTTGIFSSGITGATGFFNNLTNNYVVKQSPSGLTNSIIFDNGTSVGISNTSPSYKLDVNGTFRATGAVLFGNTLVVSSGLTVNSESTLKGLTITNGTKSVTLAVDADGNLKLDNSISGANFYATGDIAAYGSGSTLGGGGGSIGYNRLDDWLTYTLDKEIWVLSAKLGYDLYQSVNTINNELDSLALNDLTDVDTTMSVEPTGEILVKENNEWKTKLYDFIRRPIMALDGTVAETMEGYLLRVKGIYRYVGLNVVLKKEEIINDILVTKNVHYEFQDGIEDSDFKEVVYMELATTIDDEDDGKATSLGLTKELYQLIMFIDGGTL